MEKGQTLPEYLRELRRARCYKQAFVASKLNIARQTYSHYETGRIKPSAGTLYKLARLYGVSMEDLFDCMEEPEEGAPGKEWGKSENQFLRCFLKLDERDRRDIISIMEMKIRNQKEEETYRMKQKGRG